jgi:hypothetical protein
MTIKLNPTIAEGNVTTRDGAPVMLFAYFEKQQRTYIGAFYNNDAWIGCSWFSSGHYIGKDAPCGMDLVIRNIELIKATAPKGTITLPKGCDNDAA